MCGTGSSEQARGQMMGQDPGDGGQGIAEQVPSGAAQAAGFAVAVRARGTAAWQRRRLPARTRQGRAVVRGRPRQAGVLRPGSPRPQNSEGASMARPSCCATALVRVTRVTNPSCGPSVLFRPFPPTKEGRCPQPFADAPLGLTCEVVDSLLRTRPFRRRRQGHSEGGCISRHELPALTSTYLRSSG